MTIDSKTKKRKVSIGVSITWESLEKLDKIAHAKATSRSAIIQAELDKLESTKTD